MQKSIVNKVITNKNYNNSISLSYVLYYIMNDYNKLRRSKIVLFSECLNKWETPNEDKINENIKFRLTQIFDILNSFMEMSYVKNILKYIPINFAYSHEYACQEIEKSCYNKTIKEAQNHNIRCVWTNDMFVKLYHSMCYKVATNIDVNSSVQSNYVINKIEKKTIDLFSIANRPSQELCPDKYKNILKKINNRTNLKRNIKSSELYKCGKCKRNQCTTERRYNRSLDEGVNLMVHCLFCGHSWCS